MEENKLFVKLNIQRFATHLVSWDSYYLFSEQSNPSLDGDAKGEIRVYLESQNYANNTSYVRLDHYIYTKNMEWGFLGIVSATSQYRVTGPNGSTFYQTKSKSNIGYPTDGYILLGSTYHTVSHDVSGGGTFRVNGTINVLWGNDTSRTRTTDFYVSIPAIPRYADITGFSFWNNGLNQVRASWSADRAIDAVQYSLNGGAWTDTSGNTFYIGGLNPGTQYSLKIRVKSTASQLWTQSGIKYATTTDIAKITNANVNLNVDSGLNVTFSNPSGLPVSVFVETLNPTVTRTTRDNVTSPYNLQFTEAEKEALFNYSPNSNNFTIRVGVITNGAYWDWKDGTASITEANPTFSNFDYEDINPVTTALTNNPQKIIKGYSNLRARVTTANKMIANKGAIAKEYQLVIGAKQIKENYSSSANVDLILNAIDNNIFILYAIDSRINSTNYQKSPEEYIDYFKPVINDLTINRENNISTFVNLSFTGTFFNVNFGAKENEVKAKYRYKNTNNQPTWEVVPSQQEVGQWYHWIEYAGDDFDNFNYNDYFKVGDEIKIPANDVDYVYTITSMGRYQLYLDKNIIGYEPNSPIGDIFYKIEGWSPEKEILLTVSENNYYFNGLISGDLNAEGFSISDSFEIKIIVEDLLSTNEKSEILVSAMPNLGLHQDGTSINNQYDDSLGRGLQISGENIYFNGMLLFGWSDE